MPSKMASPATGLDGFVQRYRSLQAQTDSMPSLIQDLMLYCNEIENNSRLESQKLVNARRSAAEASAAYKELEAYTRKLRDEADNILYREIQAIKNHNPYIMVLIDGDGLIFREQWTQQGIEGGKEAAYALRSAVLEKFGSEARDVEIVAKVVANLAGLAKAMQRDGSLDNQYNFKDFSLGFTQAKAQIDFIDVGYGKERADSKIKETARWHLRNYNCRHIFLGISHDAGYAPFLDDIVHDEDVRSRVSIIQGVKPVPELIATKVNIQKLGGDLFRNEKLVDKFPLQAVPVPVPVPVLVPQATIPPSPPKLVTLSPKVEEVVVSRTSSPTVSNGSGQTSTPSISYATIIASSASPPPQITLPLPLKTPLSRQKSQAQSQALAQFQQIPPDMPTDWHIGPRGLDDPIRVHMQVFENVKKRKDNDKLCNNHFLRGPCQKRETCPFIHDYKPSEEEKKAIAVLARQNPCTMGQYCEQRECIYGHHCPSVKDGMCQHPHCRFSVDAHPPGTKIRTVLRTTKD